MLLYSRQCADKSESDLLFSEASSTGEAGEERFVSLLVCREQSERTKTPVITVNLPKDSMAANQPTNQPAGCDSEPTQQWQWKHQSRREREAAGSHHLNQQDLGRK